VTLLEQLVHLTHRVSGVEVYVKNSSLRTSLLTVTDMVLLQIGHVNWMTYSASVHHPNITFEGQIKSFSRVESTCMRSVVVSFSLELDEYMRLLDVLLRRGWSLRDFVLAAIEAFSE